MRKIIRPRLQWLGTLGLLAALVSLPTTAEPIRKLFVNCANVELEVTDGTSGQFAAEGKESGRVTFNREGDMLSILGPDVGYPNNAALKKSNTPVTISTTGANSPIVIRANATVIVNGKRVDPQGPQEQPLKHPLKVQVDAGTLEELKLISAKSVRLAHSGGGHLRLSVPGQGDIAASGSVDKLTIQISGKAAIQATTLEAKQVDVTISGMGDVDVFASNSLNANISGMGTVKVAGQPQNRIESISGMGSVQDIQ